MFQKTIIGSIISALSLAIVNPALAIQFRFIKLADTNTVMPDDGRPFTAFDSASISGTSVVFRGTIGQPTDPTYREGIYLLRDRDLTKIVDLTTPSPNPNFPFSQFASPILSGNNVAFLGLSPDRSLALYTKFDNQPLTAVVDAYTEPANNNPYFWKFGTTSRTRRTPPPIHMDGTSIVFEGGYGWFQGQLFPLPNPGKSPRISVNRIISMIPSRVEAVSTAPYGIRSTTGRIQLTIGGAAPISIVDDTTRLPNGTFVRDLGYFQNPLPPAPPIPAVISANTVFFFANDTNGQGGLYTRDDRRIREIIHQGTPIPDLGLIQQFGPIAISGINQAFAVQEKDITTALVMRTGGQILKVTQLGDPIDGKTITRFQPLGTQFLSGRTLVFIASFTDGSSGIYRAEAIPETVEEAIAMERDREPD